MSSLEKKMTLLILVLTGLSFLFFSVPVGLGVLAGGLLAFLNIRILINGVRAMLESSEKKNKWPLVLYVLKYPLVLALIGALILKTSLRPEAFVAGFFILIPAVLWEGLFPKVSSSQCSVSSSHT